MPLNIPDNLPAVEILTKENIFVMRETKAVHQDIRPLQIAIVNLMPLKITTEIHLLRMLSNTPLQVEIKLLHMSGHDSKNTPKEHLESFYSTFDQIKDKTFDGMIITGAPIEHLDFEQVDYWDELVKIFEFSRTNVTSTLFICWGAQAALYYYYGIPKYQMDKKIFGVFKHKVLDRKYPIIRGFDDDFDAPHSRYTEVRLSDIQKCSELSIISDSDEAGIYIVGSNNERQIFVTGHSEYDPMTLKYEYERDLSKGLAVDLPKNYFPGDDPSQDPKVLWRSHGSLLFSNWLNYYVYQLTPYDINDIPKLH